MKLKLDLINCYGINQLSEEFDFTKSDTNDGLNSLYAPNGTLKTSLAKTFKDIESEKKTNDLIFPDRVTTRNVQIDDVDIEAEQILVIESYSESYSSKQLSTLLVNENLKQQYDLALQEVDDKRNALFKALAKIFGKQAKAIPELICEAFGRPEKHLLELLTELCKQEHPDYSHYTAFKHASLFNPKVIELISSGDFNQELAEYVETYEKLIQESTVLSKTFNHQRADDVSKSLDDSGFFTASHSVNLSIKGEKQEITSREQLNQLLTGEQDRILKSPELREKFSKVDGKLKNKDTQVFRDFITEHQELLPEYQDIPLLKRKAILGYLQSQQALWEDLVGTYKQNHELVGNIIFQAQQQKTTWETVVETFNKRFSVPFKLSVDNQDEVILNNVAPAIKFEFNDGRGDTKQVNKEGLISALSQGEKRALYILNVLFEIEVRKQNVRPILVIIDDIADSFDYKNKYAIVEYLRDIAKTAHFHLLVLTHNFDFHRIISSRLVPERQNRLMAIKSPDRIRIRQETYQNDVFKAWKRNLSSNESYMLASIPFARNIADYCGQKEHYRKLTSLLHIKPDSKDIKVSDLQNIFRDLFIDQPNLTLPDGDELVIDKITQQSNMLVAAKHDSPELEFKVILAMAIRLKAEEFMISKISDPAFVNSRTSNQTRELFDKYVELFRVEGETIYLLDQVNLMTPENIHLNSFMYEPILDMSAHRLYTLYSGISVLLAP
ncbi:TPA: AAA family ATPase [Vibrio cholerae]